VPTWPLHQGLALEPTECVATVLGLAQIFREMGARTIAAAAILIGDGIAALDEISSDLGPRPWRDRSGALGSARRRFVVERAFEEHRKRPRPGRPVDIGRQHHPVARGHIRSRSTTIPPVSVIRHPFPQPVGPA
jgi:hypothetical protein